MVLVFLYFANSVGPSFKASMGSIHPIIMQDDVSWNLQTDQLQQLVA
jgi:hypothetical protein